MAAESSNPPKLTRYQLPGFGLQLDFKPHDRHPGQRDSSKLYPNALDYDDNQ